MANTCTIPGCESPGPYAGTWGLRVHVARAHKAAPSKQLPVPVKAKPHRLAPVVLTAPTLRACVCGGHGRNYCQECGLDLRMLEQVAAMVRANQRRK